MRYGIIGTGAIGGYYGAKLAHAGQEVHFLLHSDYEYVRQHGLQVDSCDGSFHLSDVNAYQQTQDMPPCDVVLVGLKTINNGKLQSLLPPLLHDHTLVVLIQNGIGVEEDVQAMFPDVQLAAGLAFICSAKTEPGVVNHQFRLKGGMQKTLLQQMREMSVLLLVNNSGNYGRIYHLLNSIATLNFRMFNLKTYSIVSIISEMSMNRWNKPKS